MEKGAVHTEQARLKIAEKMRGRKKSDQTRERMSYARTVYWQKERNRRKALKEKLKAKFQEEAPVLTLAEEKRMELENRVAEPASISEVFGDTPSQEDIIKSLTEPLGD